MMDAWDDDLDLGSSEDDEESNDVDDTAGSNIHLGQGLLFGGLSRFIEAVTQPQEEEEDSLGLDATNNAWEDDELDDLVEDDDENNEEGWGDDDDVLGQVMVEEQVQVPPSEQQQQQPVLLPVTVPPTPPVPTNEAAPPPAEMMVDNTVANGWDDDDLGGGLEDASLHEESQLQQEEKSGWNDNDVDIAALDEGGWDDTLDGLDESLEIQEPSQGAAPPPPLATAPSAPVVPPAPAPAAVEETSGSGWDDDSLEGLDEEEEELVVNVDETAPPTTTAEAEQQPQGWDNDDDDDLNISENDDIQAVVDHVPTHKTIRTTESMITNADESTVLRENARDEEEFEDDDDEEYGPVVDHLPLEEQQEERPATRTVSTLMPESCVETLQEEDKSASSLKATMAETNANNTVIDHVPDDVSNVPTSNNTDSTASVDGDEPEQASPSAAEGDDTVNGDYGRDYGPMVDLLPPEQYLPPTPRTGSSRVPSSFTESLEAESNLELVKEVDHVPDNIEDVSTKGDDSTASVDGDEPGDVLDQDTNVEAPAVVVEQPLEVDHVPDDVSNVSTENDDSTASVDGDEPADALDDEKADGVDMAEAEFGPVIDHTPSLHSVSHQPDRTVSTIAPSTVNEELDEETTTRNEADESTSAQAVVAGRRSPGVVDHVPGDASKSTNRNSTLAAATEMSVASELSNTLGDEALESDVDAQEENYGPVVDHTPLQQSIHSRRNPSIRVQAPIEEIDEETDDEEQYFGPVVDHLPTVQVSTVSSVTGSMAVAAPPSEVAEDSDDDSDGQSDIVDDEEERRASDFCDDDTLDAPTASLVSVSKYGPTLVDHVPNRPGVRPTDASTLVVVDPSEVSTVGDMTYEEQQYGPVVDHLPSSHPLVQASAAGSTIVAATASVGPDDTLVDDDDVADGARRGDENESEGDDGATLPTLDNPPTMETNVVDHVPQEAPRTFRIDSVLTTAPTQSVLSPDETRDSEFGLVVDHLPTHPLPAPPSRGSMAVLAPESAFDADTESGIVDEEVSAPAGEQPASERTTEEAKIVVDHLPPARENRSMRAAGSTVTIRSHISDDDTLEGIARPERFGPVVDQLPAAGVPVQRSLGGSTTGALATLSEVNDDTIVDEDVQGWDYDEQELDSIQDAEVGRQSRTRPASRGLSVTFSHETVKVVQGDEREGNATLFTPIADESQYFNAEMGDTPAKSVNETQETQYYEPESEEVVDDDVGEAVASRQTTQLHVNGDTKKPPAMQCTSCNDATGTECPCIQRILQIGSDEDAMVLSVMTPEGASVEIDVKKLLQDETTKRLLLEKELEAYKSTVGSLETAVSQSEAELAEDRMTTDALRESTENAARELQSIKGERDALGSQNEEFTAQLTASRSDVAEYARAAEDWAARESALLAEIEELRRTREESRSESQQLATMSDELASEVDQMRNANEELLVELDRQKGQCDLLEKENKGLVDDCASKEGMLSDRAQEISDLSGRNSALEDETLQLRRALEDSSLAATSETDLRNQLSSLQIEAATKSGECEELRAQVDQMTNKLQESEGRSFAQMKESTRVQRLHDGEVQKLREQIQSLEKSKKAVVHEHEATVLNLNNRVSDMESNLQSLKLENESLKKTINDTQREYDGQMRQDRSAFQAQTSQLRAAETRLKLLETQKAKAFEDLASTRLRLQVAEEQSHAAVALREEYDSLQETLAVNKETILSLQEQVDVLSQANKTGTDQMETLVESISSERDELRGSLQSAEEDMQALQSELQTRSNEKASLEDRLEALAAKCGEMEASAENVQSNVNTLEIELAEKDRLCESLQESQSRLDSNSASQLREEHEREVHNLNQRISDRDQSLQLLQSQLDSYVAAVRDRDVTISELEQHRSETQECIEVMTRDRDDALSRLNGAQEELARAKEQLMSFNESAEHQSIRERELQENVESLISERDAALKERDMMEEDSEELLVQLGLMKEQLDAHDGEVAELQQMIAEKDIAVKHAEDRLREAENYIGELSRTEEEEGHLQENGDHDSGKLAELEQAVEELTLEKEDLQQQVDDLSSTNAYIDAQVTSLRDEKVELLERLGEMEQLKQASAADAAVAEQHHQSRARELEEQCRHLDEVCRLKDEELAATESQLCEAQRLSAASQADVLSLQRQIVQLENACSEQGQVLHDRDRALEDMRLEIEGLRSRDVAPNGPMSTDADIHGKLLHAERTANHYQERLRETETVLEQARRELKAKTEKLSETESALFDRELELDLQKQEEGAQGELQRQLHEMETLLHQRNQEIQDAFERERSMEKTLGALQADLASPQSTSSNAVEETRQLRAQLSTLQQQLQSSSTEHVEREERARQEVIALNETIASKKEQILSLEAQLQSLSVEFSSSQDQLVSKEADYRRLSLELEETRGDQLQSTRTVTSQVLESSSKEQAESVDNMRSHIISLAQALERSETQRADAIERLLNERKASADSLRRLGESVKRFYTSLSYRDV